MTQWLVGIFVGTDRQGPSGTNTILTDALLRALKPSDRAQKISDTGGLYLIIVPSGGRYWRYNYRFHGKQKTLALGVYPDVRLAQARVLHQEARRQLADGIAPSVKR